MNQDQSDELTMLESVDEILTTPENQPKIDPIADLKAGEIELNKKIGELKDNREIQVADTTGVAKNKDEIQDLTIEAIMVLAGALVNLGRQSSNNVLIEKYNFTDAALKAMRDNDLLSIASNTSEDATTNLLDLAPGGVTQAMIDDLDNKIEALTAINTLPEGTIQTKKVAKEKIESLFVETRLLMDQTLKPLMRTNFKSSDPTFYNEFMVRTEIITTGHRTLAMLGSVFNNATADKISAAKLTLKLNGVIILDEIKTGPKGNFRVPKELESGIYEMTVERPGFVTKTFPGIVIIKTERLRINFGLDAV